MTNIKVDDFIIPLYDGPIGIFHSGGADSSLLLYILMKHASQHISIFNCGNGKTNYQETESSARVINWIIRKTGNHNVTSHVHWAEHKNATSGMNIPLIAKLDVDTIYLGLTRLPPEGEIIDYDKNAAADNGHDDNVIHQTYWENSNRPPWYFFEENKNLPDLPFSKNYALPFSNINKQKIASLYRFLKIEELYSLTRSCESTSLLRKHCGECWWCKERIWGFGYLD